MLVKVVANKHDKFSRGEIKTAKEKGNRDCNHLPDFKASHSIRKQF
jgi:hypothetical protein